MRPEANLAKRLTKILCLRLVSWEQRIMMTTQSGSLKSYIEQSDVHSQLINIPKDIGSLLMPSSTLFTKQSMHSSCTDRVHVCIHAFTVLGLRSIARVSAIVRLSDSFMNLDSVCSGMLFRVLFSLNRLCWTFFSLSKLAFDLTSTPSMAVKSRHLLSISLPKNHVEHSFCKARQLWTLSKLLSTCDYFEKRTRKHQRPDKSFSAANRQAVHNILPVW